MAKVIPKYYLPLDGSGEAFIFDLVNAFEQAHRARDEGGADHMRHIFYVHFQNDLLNRRPKELIDHFETRIKWRTYKSWEVVKTPDEPCLAYTAQKSPDGSITVTALGICYRYPKHNEEAWWKEVIEPRVKRLA